MLKEKTTGKNICVCSAYLKGFNLATVSSNVEQQKEAEKGDLIEKELLHVMGMQHAPVKIFGGDFNATPKHYRKRSKILHNNGFTVISDPSKPTIFDANLKEKGNTPKAVCLDYIYAKSQNNISSTPLSLTKGSFADWESKGSDHGIIGTQITVH